MRKFRFIGSERQARDYSVNLPVYGIIYTEGTRIGAGNVEEWIEWDVVRGEWEEVVEDQSAPSKEERIEFMGQFMRQFDISFDDLKRHL